MSRFIKHHHSLTITFVLQSCRRLSLLSGERETSYLFLQQGVRCKYLFLKYAQILDSSVPVPVIDRVKVINVCREEEYYTPLFLMLSYTSVVILVK